MNNPDRSLNSITEVNQNNTSYPIGEVDFFAQVKELLSYINQSINQPSLDKTNTNNIQKSLDITIKIGEQDIVNTIHDLDPNLININNSQNHPRLDEEVQEELSKLINLIERIQKTFLKIDKSKQSDRQKIASTLSFLKTAVLALLQESPNKTLAKRIRRHIECSIRPFEKIRNIGLLENFLRDILYVSSTPTKVMIGLGLITPLCVLVLSSAALLRSNYYAQYDNSQTKTQVDNFNNLEKKSNIISNKSNSQFNALLPRIVITDTQMLVIIAASAGALGSVVSIMTRIEQYQNKQYEDDILPFAVGFFKPLIGASFGILILTILNSSLLPVSFTNRNQTGQRPETERYAFFAIAFIIGFSERFANDIVSKAENTLGASTKSSEQEDKKS